MVYLVFSLSQKSELHNIPPSSTSILNTEDMHCLRSTIFFPTESRHSLRTTYNTALGATITTWLKLVYKGKSVCYPTFKLIITFWKVVWAVEFPLMDEQDHTSVFLLIPPKAGRDSSKTEKATYLYSLPFWTTVPLEYSPVTDGSTSKCLFIQSFNCVERTCSSSTVYKQEVNILSPGYLLLPKTLWD